jgi:hypothetical protein
MKSLKITNEGSGYYEVEVHHPGGSTETHSFDSHGSMTDFVEDLKKMGYAVVNRII